jgi:hypothetical protein
LVPWTELRYLVRAIEENDHDRDRYDYLCGRDPFNPWVAEIERLKVGLQDKLESTSTTSSGPKPLGMAFRCGHALDREHKQKEIKQQDQFTLGELKCRLKSAIYSLPRIYYSLQWPDSF